MAFKEYLGELVDTFPGFPEKVCSRISNANLASLHHFQTATLTQNGNKSLKVVFLRFDSLKCLHCLNFIIGEVCMTGDCHKKSKGLFIYSCNIEAISDDAICPHPRFVYKL
jgi:hypothetical protein